MAEILFVTWDGGGNLPPALGLAAELLARGHIVRFLGHAQQRRSIEAAGFGFAAYAHARPGSSTEPNAGLSGAARIFAMFTDDGPGTDLLAELARRPADLVVLDCMSLGALRAAERAGLRRGLGAHLLPLHDSSVESRPDRPDGPVEGTAPEAAVGQRRPRPGRIGPRARPRRGSEPACVAHHIGVVQPAPLLPDGDRAGPDVLVSLSTTFFPGQDRALQSILDALAPLLPVRALVTIGEAADPATLRPPGNVEVHRLRPHAEVLPSVRMVIGHGGHSTTMRALSHDLPLLVMPMHPMLDQKMIGQSVQEHGAARLLSKTASLEQIREAAGSLLESGPHTAAAIGSRLRAHSGAVIGADRLAPVLADL